MLRSFVVFYTIEFVAERKRCSRSEFCDSVDVINGCISIMSSEGTITAAIVVADVDKLAIVRFYGNVSQVGWLVIRLFIVVQLLIYQGSFGPIIW